MIYTQTVFNDADENVNIIISEMLSKVNPFEFQYPNLIKVLSGLNNTSDSIPSAIINEPQLLFFGQDGTSGVTKAIFDTSPPEQINEGDLRIYINGTYSQNMAGKSNIYQTDNTIAFYVWTNKNNNQIYTGSTYPKRKLNMVCNDLQNIATHVSVRGIRGKLVPVAPKVVSLYNPGTDYIGKVMLFKFTGI